MPAKREADLYTQITFQTSSSDTVLLPANHNYNKVWKIGLQKKTDESDIKIYEKETHSNATV